MLIYWFKNKITEETFAIEEERQVVMLLQRKNFRYDYEFIGKSSGKKYKEILKEGKQYSSKEFLDTFLNGVDSARTELIKRAQEAEIQEAAANPDKSLPRKDKYDVMDVAGNPSENNAITDMVKLMAKKNG